MEPKPLSEQVNDITNVPVTTARSNVHQELKQIDDRLNRLTVPQHGLCLQMLKSMFDVREAAMKDALAEHQFKMAAAHEREQARKQAALEKEQADIAEANKPKLAVVTQ